MRPGLRKGATSSTFLIVGRQRLTVDKDDGSTTNNQRIRRVLRTGLVSLIDRTYRISQRNYFQNAAEAKKKLNAAGPNFAMDMTWERLILPSLSKKRPKK